LPAHLMFADNFSVQTNSTSINPSSNDLPGRQSGIYRGATYTERAGTPADFVQVDHADYPGALRLAGQVGSFNLASVSPDVNFDAFGGPSHFVLEYSVKPTDLAGNVSWAAAVVGSSSQIAGVNSSDGIGLLVRQTGGYQIFDGTSGTNVSKQSGTLATPLDPDGWYDVRINYFVPEFDDVTRGGVSIFVDDALIYSAATDSGFANNYLVFMGYSEGTSGTIAAHGFDNIRFWTTAIPEPSTAVLLALGLGLLPLRRGRRAVRERSAREVGPQVVALHGAPT
ncbi:MAG: PEP-CTERM sorting domain-containing protein, partial [Patescibacteria group bacterium]|nr:PEP-CTERM sorting domain-containing protein [Patescibacteria group bacterium]